MDWNNFYGRIYLVAHILYSQKISICFMVRLVWHLSSTCVSYSSTWCNNGRTIFKYTSCGVYFRFCLVIGKIKDLWHFANILIVGIYGNAIAKACAPKSEEEIHQAILQKSPYK
ncbi:MAG: hypothetical protein NZM44_06125 [Candidatus Calescibacterium sp.]|nr:hypothetical protein [Candidatus Calescibacterium sp.]